MVMPREENRLETSGHMTVQARTAVCATKTMSIPGLFGIHEEPP
jgi:hypothetical protein